MNVQTPDWVRDAIFYQIFPDRFYRSPRTTHPPHLTFKPWGTDPAEQGYQGGDLKGIVDKLDYLVDLGINALYLNPVFMSASNHRYHTYDYYKVDPLLGGNDALRELIDEAHARNIKVILDGVFNHASRGHWAFHHILENGGNSPYIDWFVVEDWPLRPYVHDEDNPHNYQAWWDIPALPEFNTDNPDVRNYIFDIARHWIDFGADGWRLDVPAEIDDDAFWQAFRTVVKEANPEAYIVGEIWEDASRWLKGDQFDAVMNYIFTWVAISFCGAQTLRDGFEQMHYDVEPRDAAETRDLLDWMFGLYPRAINEVQMNLLDSHDTARALWIMGDDVSALRLCVLLQMTLPGAPCIYYGDDIGLSADTDPHCREAFPWDDKDSWHTDLRDHYKGAIALRNNHVALRRGDYHALYGKGEQLAFMRTHPEQQAVVLFNVGKEAATVTLESDAFQKGTYHTVWGAAQEIHVKGGAMTVTIPPRDALVLV